MTLRISFLLSARFLYCLLLVGREKPLRSLLSFSGAKGKALYRTSLLSLNLPLGLCASHDLDDILKVTSHLSFRIRFLPVWHGRQGRSMRIHQPLMRIYQLGNCRIDTGGSLLITLLEYRIAAALCAELASQWI